MLSGLTNPIAAPGRLQIAADPEAHRHHHLMAGMVHDGVQPATKDDAGRRSIALAPGPAR